MGKIDRRITYKRRCVACGQREDPTHGLAVHYNCLTCVACKSFFYRSGKQLRASGVQDHDLARRSVYESVLDNHARYTKCLKAGMEPRLVLDPSKKSVAKSRRGRGRGRGRSTSTRVKTSNAGTQTEPVVLWPRKFNASHIPMLQAALAQAHADAKLLALPTSQLVRHGATVPAAKLEPVTTASYDVAPPTSTPSAPAPLPTFSKAAKPPHFPPCVDVQEPWIVHPNTPPMMSETCFADDVAALSELEPAHVPSVCTQQAATAIGASGCASAGVSDGLTAFDEPLAPPALPDSTLCDPFFQRLLFGDLHHKVTTPHPAARAPYTTAS